MGIVRIPLDYYRILGLPIQATAEQLQQAHRDRTQQLPRREFSEAAIASRLQLLDDAYAVLSDPEQRQEYDTSFLAKSYELLEVNRSIGFQDENEEMASAPIPEAEAYSPSVEISDSQLVGALLILQELGEYELVLRLGRPYLNGGNLSLRAGDSEGSGIFTADIVLTVALACLELGREQWQQGQYENAAESLETGQQLLLREGIFASLRGDMQSDLYKLRPYRILELLAMPGNREDARRQGLSLLEDMLQDRGGIDGSGNDQSGLSVDDFLRFIQQLRSYLTATEQQALFEAESRRPSAVASYLSVYALIARGFAERQPSLIRRAKLLLLRLGTRQDVHLEQAVCALLLGQTDEASRALELSQEFESLAFIREHSNGSPDLLPGLCLYSERWLQNEVFPHFRDLSRKQPSLKEYFADQDVQAYLEELPNEPEIANQWSRPQVVSPARTARREAAVPLTRQGYEAGVYSGGNSSGAIATVEAPGYSNNGSVNLSTRPATDLHLDNRNGTRTQPANLDRPDAPLPSATRVVQPDQPRRSPGAPRLDRLLFLAAAGILGLLLLGFLASRIFGRPQAPANAVESASPGLAQITQQSSRPVSSSASLTKEEAKTVVDSWLAAKSAAMGETHDTAALEKVLAEPLLSQWKQDSEQVKSNGSYLKYEHSAVEIISVETDESTPAADAATSSPSPSASSSTDQPGSSGSSDSSSGAAVGLSNQATIEASVTEKIESFTNGKPDAAATPETLRVRYNLTRQDGQWLIESIEPL